MEELIKQDINIVQMPCPESQFGGYIEGLKRAPKGIDGYDNPAFKGLCTKLASETVDMAKAIFASGYDIIAIMGIENSPSCAVNYQYSNKGTIRRAGIYTDILRNMLKKEGMEIRFIGINRRGINKSLSEVKRLFEESKQAKLSA